MKPGHAVRAGARLLVRQGVELVELVVCGLSEQRGPANIAQLLYEETAESVGKRLATAELRKAAALCQPTSKGRPDKRQRRQLQQFHREADQD